MKLGLLGFGYWGRNVARALARVGDLAYICDPHVGRREEATREWSSWGVRVTGHADDLLNHCDAVWVATPTADHVSTVDMALQAGLHVMCEKPVVVGMEPAAALVEQARARGRLLMGGFLGIHTGCHGGLLDITRPREIQIIRRNTQASLSDGDVLWGLGPHDVASVLALAPPSSPLPNVVRADGNTHRVCVEMVWDDYAPLRATIELDWLAEEKQRAVYVNGDRSVNWAERPNRTEPLLAEADLFVRLCGLDPAEWEAEYDRILAVTNVLDRAHQDIQP